MPLMKNVVPNLLIWCGFDLASGKHEKQSGHKWGQGDELSNSTRAQNLLRSQGTLPLTSMTLCANNGRPQLSNAAYRVNWRIRTFFIMETQDKEPMKRGSFRGDNGEELLHLHYASASSQKQWNWWVNEKTNGDSPPLFIHFSNPRYCTYITYLLNKKLFDSEIY